MFEIKSAFVARIDTIADEQGHEPHQRASLHAAAAEAGAPYQSADKVSDPPATMVAEPEPQALDATVVTINIDDTKACPVVAQERGKKVALPSVAIVSRSAALGEKASLQPAVAEQLLKTAESFNERLVQIDE